PAGHQNQAFRCSGEKRADVVRRYGVVKDDQRPPLRQSCPVEGRAILIGQRHRKVWHTQRAKDTPQRWLLMGLVLSRLYVDDSVRELSCYAVSPRQGQGCLSDPGCPGEKSCTRVSAFEQLIQTANVVGAAYEGCRSGWYISGFLLHGIAF